MKNINFNIKRKLQETVSNKKTENKPETEFKPEKAEISEQDMKKNSQAITNIERARINMSIDDRDKADGRMIDSFGENKSLNKPIARFYPEDVKNIEKLIENGDYAGAAKLKKALIEQGKCFYQ
jgi:hypothetical protein